MAIEDERAAMLEALEKILSTNGWSRRDDVRLPEEVGWTPDRIFIHRDGTTLAVELEEEVNIPRFIIRRLQSHKELMGNTKVLIAALRNTPLDISTARAGVQNDISIYADVRNPTLVLDSSLPTRIASLSAESVKTAHDRFLAHKRIPLVIIQQLTETQTNILRRGFETIRT